VPPTQLSKPVVWPAAPRSQAPPSATVPSSTQPMTPRISGSSATMIQVHFSPASQPVCRLALQRTRASGSSASGVSMMSLLHVIAAAAGGGRDTKEKGAKAQLLHRLYLLFRSWNVPAAGWG
jgi:hypothetical protein